MIKYEFKGTPGPWDYEIEHGCVTQICAQDSEGHSYPQICKFEIYKIYRGDQSQSEEFANAKLIAAAPDMFELLKRAFYCLEIIGYLEVPNSTRMRIDELLSRITSNGS